MFSDSVIIKCERAKGGGGGGSSHAPSCQSQGGGHFDGGSKIPVKAHVP